MFTAVYCDFTLQVGQLYCIHKVGEYGQIRPVYNTDTKQPVFLRQIIRYDTDRKRAAYTLYTAVNAPF